MSQGNGIATSAWQAAQDNLGRLFHQMKSSPTRVLATAIGASTFIWVYSLSAANYRKWKSLGKAGLPGNPLGWAMERLAYLTLKSESKGTAIYDEQMGQGDKYAKYISEKEETFNRTSFLPAEGIPQRAGERPVIADFAAPQRQENPDNDVKLLEAQIQILDDIQKDNPSTTSRGESVLEGGGPALYIQSSVPVPQIARKHRMEIAHIHPFDRSSHCTLSYKDAKEIIEKGWGERHPLSGAPLIGLATSYVMLYAPRSEEEVKVLESILKAAANFMTALA